MPGRYPVYVVDDHQQVRAMLCALCEERGLAATAFADGAALLAELDALAPGCLLLDMRLPIRSGIEVQAEIVRRGAPLAVVAISGHGFVDLAVEAMKLGAVDFIEKPFDEDALFEAVALAFRQLDERLGGA